FRRDIIKALPVALVSIPPFANYLVFVLMYFFPRQVLIRHFWTPKQQVEFQQVYHSQRARLYPWLVNDLTRTAPEVSDRDLQSQLLQLCNKVAYENNKTDRHILKIHITNASRALSVNSQLQL
ncbi:UNVERIFIED_CONTAM: hypothetical protein FKN15_064961, partial [Acipenser sinensis]